MGSGQKIWKESESGCRLIDGVCRWPVRHAVPLLSLLVSFVTGQFTAGRHEILTHFGETAKWEPWRGRWWRRLAPRWGAPLRSHVPLMRLKSHSLERPWISDPVRLAIYFQQQPSQTFSFSAPKWSNWLLIYFYQEFVLFLSALPDRFVTSWRFLKFKYKYNFF